MLWNHFKTSEELPNFEKDLLNLIDKYYSSSIRKSVTPEIQELIKLRQIIKDLNIFKSGDEVAYLKQSKEQLVRYHNHVSMLFKKFMILKNSEKVNVLVKLDKYFAYRERITDRMIYEGFVNEPLFVLCNICTCYQKLGSALKKRMLAISPPKDDEIKESLKCFQAAEAGLKLLIQNINYYSSKKLYEICDFQKEVIEIEIAYCNAELQSLTFHLAESKNLDFELQASLAKAASKMFGDIPTNLVSLTKNLREEFTLKCKYSALIYLALTYEKLGNHALVLFKINGVNFTHTISYLKESYQNLETAKSLISDSRLSKLPLNYLQLLINRVDNALKERMQENNKIYCQPIKDIQYMAQPTECIKYKNTEFPDDIEEAMPSLFKLLEPVKQVEAAESIKKRQMICMLNKLSIICSLNDVQLFREEILNFDLGAIIKYMIKFELESCMIKPNTIIFNGIVKVKEIGGNNFLMNAIHQINSSYTLVVTQVNILREKLTNEQNFDQEARTKYIDDEKAKRLNLDYNKVVTSVYENKSLMTALGKLQKSTETALDIDTKICKRIEALLHPQLTIPLKEGPITVPCISFLNANRLEKINEVINLIATSDINQNTKDSYNQLAEWVKLKGLLREFNSLVDDSTIKREKLKLLIESDSLYEINEVPLDECSIDQLIESKIDEAFESEIIKSSLLDFKGCEQSLEVLKQKIIEANIALRQKLLETDSQYQLDQLTIDPDVDTNSKVAAFISAIENSLKEFFELVSCIKFSESFYFQQSQRIREIHVAINKYLVNRIITHNNYITLYENECKVSKPIDMPLAAKALIQEIELIEGESKIKVSKVNS